MASGCPADDPGLYWRGMCRRSSGRLVGAVLAAAVVTAITSCATVPSRGVPQSLVANGGQQQAFVQPLPPAIAPTKDWIPQQVIAGFLHASANLALDPSAASQFLAPGVIPHPGVVIVMSSITQTQTEPAGLSVRNAGTQVETWQVSGQPVASLSQAGLSINGPGTAGSYKFTLAKYNGVWLIQSLPRLAGLSGTPLIMFQTDFQQVYYPRDLYFFPQKSTDFPQNSTDHLVPDPIYVPLQGPNSAVSPSALASRLVEGLITGLRSDPLGWLSDAAVTAFPDGTSLIGNVTINNLTATVNLGGSAVSATPVQKQQMYAQLFQTLTSNAYPHIADSVQLEFDGKPLATRGVAYSVPPVAVQQPLYFASGGVIYQQSGGSKPVAVARPGQLGSLAGITAIASSRAVPPQLAVAIPYAAGCAIEVWTPGSALGYRSLPLSRRGGPCTSLSWDNSGDLWAAAGSRIWFVQPGHNPQPVSAPVFAPSGAAVQVLAVRIAPDDVRAALLLQVAGRNELFLAGVSYTSVVSFGPAVPIGATGTNDLSDPKAVSWYSPDYLEVLAGSEVFQVPLTGGPAQNFLPVPFGTTSMTANGSVNGPIAVGTSGGQISVTSGPDGSLYPAVRGTVPAYPG